MRPGATGCTYLLGIAMTMLAAGCAVSTPVYGLRPQYPKAQFQVKGRNFRIVFVQVDSLQPTLRWESFPTEDDREADKEGLLSRIHNVTYDLKVFRAENDLPTGPIYIQRGLAEPWHSLGAPLEPSTKYFWTVRARFELDGRTRVTPWGQAIQYEWTPRGPVDRDGLIDLVVPSPFYYGLKTPAK